MRMKLKRFLGILLSLALVLSLLPGMSLTAHADTPQPIFQFTSENNSCTLVGYDGSGALYPEESTKVDKINKIEVIIESEGAEYALIQWGYFDVNDNNEPHLSQGNVSTAVGVCRSVVEGNPSGYEWSIAQVVHNGNGKLWWAKVYYDDGTSTEFGTWKDVTDVSIAPTESTMKVGETTTLTAAITPDDATVKKVTWSVANNNVKLYSDEQCENEVGTAPTNCLTVYAKGIAAGSETITVNSNAVSEKCTSYALTIDKGDPTAVAPTGLTATYGQTLADVTLTNLEGNTEGTWAWVDTTTSVGEVGEHTFPANFTPTDTDQYNGVNNVNVAVTVTAADVPYASLKNTTRVITFDNKQWYLIDYDDSTVTLLSKECVGASKYNPDENYDSTYSGSTVESFVNSWYRDHISEDAKAAVNGSGMFLLIKDQAIKLSTDVLKCSHVSGAYTNHWWLCSPGNTNSSAACVYGEDGTVPDLARNVWVAYGVRPALKLNLESVIFSSESNTFTVGSAKDTQTITASDVTATFGDTGKKIEAATTGNGTLSYAVKSGEAVTVDENGALTIVKVGTATVTVTASETDTYVQATKDVTVTVNTKDMTVSAEDVNVTVDGQPHGITVNVTDPASGATVKYGTEEGSYTLDASPTQAVVGEKTVYYQVTADNYTTYTGSAKVTVSDKSTQTINASDVTATYGDTNKKVEATTDGNGAISYAVKEGSADYIDVDSTTGALTIKKVGTATVVVTAAETDTYVQATKEVTVTINKANAVAATVTANNRTYDGTDKPLVNVDDSTLVGGEMRYILGENATTAPADNLYTTSIPTSTDAGTYYVWYKVVGDENHNDTEAARIAVKVLKKPLSVTAETKSKTYGKNDPELTYTTEGLVGDDTLTGAPVREQGENAGTYAIRQGTLFAGGNYALTFAGANFTINKAAVTITADDKSSKYKEDMAALTYRVGGDYVDGDDLGVTVSTDAQKTSPVGAYDINVGWNRNPNYTATLNKGRYTITKAELSVTASGYDGTYDGKAHGITVDVGGSGAAVYYGTSELTSVNYKTAGSTTNPQYTAAGEYTVYYYVDSDNYEPVPVSGSKIVRIAKATDTIAESSSYASLTLGSGAENVEVNGLNALLEEKKEDGKKVIVTMSVDKKDNGQTEGSMAIESVAGGMRLEYLDISLTKTVDGTQSQLTETNTVLEIVVPYDFSKKMQTTVAVYRYHNKSATVLTENNTKADGTYRLDRENNRIYIYASRFSTYAIGFKPTYKVSGTLGFGNFTGAVGLTLTGNGITKTASGTVTKGRGSYSFAGIPAGTYSVTVNWSENGKEQSLTFAVTVPTGAT